MFLNQVSQDKPKTNNRTKEKAIKKKPFPLETSCFFNALADEDFDLLQLTQEKRPELVAVVNQEGNDTTHTTGENVFHVYFAHLKTSYVD